MRERNWVAMAGVLTVLACGSAVTGPLASEAEIRDVQLADTVELRPGQSARVQGQGILILFEGIVEDSRCPTDVACVHAGDAVARLRLSGTSRTVSALLHTNSEPAEVEFANVAIRLVRVAPEPVSTRIIRPDGYTVFLAISTR